MINNQHAAYEIPLLALRPNQSFTLMPMNWHGVKISNNQSACKVKLFNGPHAGTAEWSNMSPVVPGDVIEGDALTITASDHIELKCEKCGKVCSSSSGLTLHRKNCMLPTAEPTNPQMVELRCDVCGKQCSSPSGLTLHKKNAHGAKRE